MLAHVTYSLGVGGGKHASEVPYGTVYSTWEIITFSSQISFIFSLYSYLLPISSHTY